MWVRERALDKVIEGHRCYEMENENRWGLALFEMWKEKATQMEKKGERIIKLKRCLEKSEGNSI